jgi:hypothetical protein
MERGGSPVGKNIYLIIYTINVSLPGAMEN